MRIKQTPSDQPNHLEVTWRPVSSITPFTDNPRQHSRAQIRKLQRSLKKYGWTNPLIIDDAGNLICGHGRLEAALLDQITEVPVINLG